LDSPHTPVLGAEVVELLSGKAAVIDATVGAGGHAEALLEAGVHSVLGLDRDQAAIEVASRRLSRFGDRFRSALSRFSMLAETARGEGFSPAGGVLYDLGVSSMQLDDPSRGFSYRSSGPLDMRMGDEDRPNASDVVNGYPEDRLAQIFLEYGEERFARRIARAVVRARSRSPIRSTAELAAVVAGAVPKRRGGPHPARRAFQAIRIEVNGELEELTASLPHAVSLLEPSGRLVVISYHSLEDRIVKRFIAGAQALSPLTRKPVRPGAAEVSANPRSRAARLRSAELSEQEAA
jgi:16S rRNA (cytosine1402-N4)-methyltransferase